MAELTDKQQALLDELLKDFKGDARDIFGEGGLLKTISKRAIEAALEGEMTHHLGYPAHDPSGRGSGNSRNGRSTKRLENDAASGNLAPARLKHALDRARSARGTFHIEPVDLFHHGKVLLALAPRGVVGRRTTQRQEPRLANHRQGMEAIYPRPALDYRSRPSAFDKKSFSIDNSPIFA